MWRMIILFFILAAALTVLRRILLVVLEPLSRRSYTKQFGKDAEKVVETHVARWRTKTGRSLWINMVGIPLCVFFIIVFIAQFM